MKSLQRKLMESLTENVPAQIEQSKQLVAGDDVLVDWDGEQVTAIVVSVADDVVKVNRVIDGETVDRDYTLSQIQSLEEPIEVEAVALTEALKLNIMFADDNDKALELLKSNSIDFTLHKDKETLLISNRKELTKAEELFDSNGIEYISESVNEASQENTLSKYLQDLDLSKLSNSVNVKSIITGLSNAKDINDGSDVLDWLNKTKGSKIDLLDQDNLHIGTLIYELIVESVNESVALTALVQQWDDMYGENFAKEYPEAFKKMKAKNSKTLTDIEAVWLDVYGEQFKDEYQGIYTALSKTLNEDDNEVDENVTESLESEQFINRIKALDAKFELYHHNTGSFAKHKTFDDIYTEFDQLEDDLIEKIMGYTGEKYTGVNIDLVYSDNTGQELVNDLMNLGSGLQEFAKANGYSDIEQYGQTIHGLGAKLNYLLTFNENVSEAVVNDKESFKEYAETVMKQAHGDNYDQAIVDKIVDDIASEVGDDWGAAVGQLTSGLGEDLKPLPDATSNADGIAMRTESKDLSVADYDKLSDKDKKRYVYNKETDTWMFDSTVSEAVDKEEPKSKEYEAGLAAGEEGTLNEEDCPYEAGTDEAKDWSEGYKAGCKQ